MTGADRSLFAAMMAVASGLELHDTLRRIAQAAADLVDARFAALGVLGQSHLLDEFIVVGMSKEDAAEVGELPRGRGLLGQLISHPTALRLDDLTTHPASVGFPPGHPPMHSFLGVPVRVRGEVFGNLYLTEKRGGRHFTEEDEDTVSALAAWAGVAIENSRLFERTRARERWQRAVTEIDNAVLAGADAGDVLTMVAARARRLADAEVAIVCLPGEAAELTVEIVESRSLERHSGRVIGGPVPPDSILNDSYRLGQLRVGTSIGLGDALGTVPDNGPVVVLPLRTPDRVLGVIALLRTAEQTGFSPQQLELAEAFATQAAVTLVLAESRIERERLAVYEDRDRIGRDLHDLVIQSLFATGMQLQGLTRASGVPPEVASGIEKAVDDLDATVREIRHTIFALQNGVAHESSSVRARVLAETGAAAELLGFSPSVHFTGAVDARLPAHLGDHLVAALREGLSNAVRHAGATSVSVSVVVDRSAVELTVSDNGVGLPDGGRRSGLENLASRAHEAGGEFTARRRSEGGTQLQWRAPLGD